MFNSHNPIKQFSLSIVEDICEDISRPIDLFLSSGETLSINANTYGLVVDDLNLHDNLLCVINSHYSKLNEHGMLVMNILGGASLHELTNAMMQADLLENRFVTRMLPKISAEGFLSLANQLNFTYKTVMSNSTTLNYKSVQEVIQSLREIKLTKKISDNQPTSRKYFESVQNIFENLYSSSVTIEVLTLLAVR